MAGDRSITHHHARCSRVRAEMRTKADTAWDEWMTSDPLAAAMPSSLDEAG
ncbi:MAG: hypothetical protein ACKVWR_03520 [Acidimicrobiales bacterium]